MLQPARTLLSSVSDRSFPAQAVVRAIEWAPDGGSGGGSGRVLASLDNLGWLRVWDLTAPSWTPLLEAPHSVTLTTLQWNSQLQVSPQPFAVVF